MIKNAKKVEPDFSEFFITRRRKKYKFAKFDSFDNCFDGFNQTFTDVKKRLKFSKQEIIVEIAAGSAFFSVELAKQNPKKVFVAFDIKGDRLYQGAKLALEQNVKNIAFVRLALVKIDDFLPKKSVDQLWLTFPDPFPRERSEKHRLTYPSFLTLYKNILKPKADLHFKTDNRNLFLWSLEQFVNGNWQIKELSFDLHNSNLTESYKIKTTYETRFMSEGIPINYTTITPIS